MHNPFINGHKHLTTAWKTLRAELTTDATDTEQLDRVAKFWSLAPLTTRVLDWDNPTNWPDAWNLMYQNNFDESAVSLGMFYSLIYATDNRWNADRLQLQLITHRQKSFQSIILEIDGHRLLNLEYNLVIERQTSKKGYTVQHKYGYKDDRHWLLTTGNMVLHTAIKTNDNATI